MAHVDFHSRNPLPSKELRLKDQEKRVNLLEISKNWLHAEQQRDHEIAEIVSKLNNDDLPLSLLNTYQIISGVLHRKIQRNGRTRSLPMVPHAFRCRANGQVERVIVHLRICLPVKGSQSQPLELLIGKVARPLSLLALGDQDQDDVDIVGIREQAVNSINANAEWIKSGLIEERLKFRSSQLVTLF
ncbi:hypothetical protein EVAR_84053_1 [Eumeta japonica]|uniref:Uncharacterized protein n=1 Tax=Eumeta variegata TaxID=151549 RepID=A0A4C1ZY64_EUMVA|nr:hypothetical protein EVAR_84053_1 [Eumeta japonica]